LFVGCEEPLEPEDCAGVVGETAVVDDCGICDGIDGYVAGSCYDCADTPNGDAVIDNCGTCDNDLSNDCVPDCAGVWGGYTICGCTDYNALNYTLFSTYDDGSCIYDTTPPAISNLTLDWLYCNSLDVCTEALFGLGFSASAYDYESGIDYAEAWIDFTSLGKAYYSTFNWTWNPFFENEGYKTFKVRAYDESGNYSEATKTFYYIPD